MSGICFFTCVVYLTVIVRQVSTNACLCPTPAGCTRPRWKTNVEKEVFVVTEGTSDYTTWDWESFTGVLAPENHTNPDVMCYSHNQNKRYGFIANLKHADHFSTSDKTEERIKKICDESVRLGVDMVAVNLIDVMAKMDEKEAVDFGKVLFKLKKSLTPPIHKSLPVEMICVVPWKPKCYGKYCKFTDDIVYHSCDLIMIDATSFEVFAEPDACRARATVPFTHLAVGVDEYAAAGIAERRIILGISWHGYRYKCHQFIYEGKPDSLCLLATTTDPKTNETNCEYRKSRTKITAGEMNTQHKKEMAKSGWSYIYEAPVYNVFKNDTTDTYQVWYENFQSLRMKYQYAHDVKLKGIAIYFGEDLSDSTSLDNKGFNGGMWNWVLHGILKTTVTQPPPVKYHSDVVVGASIGCLFLGIFIGALFTCLALRRTVKKPREAPFKNDQIEYHDEDDHLHMGL